MFSCVNTPIQTKSSELHYAGRNGNAEYWEDEKSERASFRDYFPRILPGRRKSHHRQNSSLSSLDSAETLQTNYAAPTQPVKSYLNPPTGQITSENSLNPMKSKKHHRKEAMRTRKALGMVHRDPPPVKETSSSASNEKRSNSNHSEISQSHNPPVRSQKVYYPPPRETKKAIVIPSEILSTPQRYPYSPKLTHITEEGDDDDPNLHYNHTYHHHSPENENLPEEPLDPHHANPAPEDQDFETASSSYPDPSLPTNEILDKVLEEGIRLKSKYKQVKLAYQQLHQEYKEYQQFTEEQLRQCQSAYEKQCQELKTSTYFEVTALKESHQQEISQCYMKINRLENHTVFLSNEKNELLVKYHQLLQEKERWKLSAMTSVASSSHQNGGGTASSVSFALLANLSSNGSVASTASGKTALAATTNATTKREEGTMTEEISSDNLPTDSSYATTIQELEAERSILKQEKVDILSALSDLIPIQPVKNQEQSDLEDIHSSLLPAEGERSCSELIQILKEQRDQTASQLSHYQEELTQTKLSFEKEQQHWEEERQIFDQKLALQGEIKEIIDQENKRLYDQLKALQLQFEQSQLVKEEKDIQESQRSEELHHYKAQLDEQQNLLQMMMESKQSLQQQLQSLVQENEILRQTVNFNHQSSSSAASFLTHPQFRKEAPSGPTASNYGQRGAPPHYVSGYPSSQGIGNTASHFLPPPSSEAPWQRQVSSHRFGANSNIPVRASIYEEISSARGQTLSSNSNTNGNPGQDISPLYDRQKFQRLKQRFETPPR